MGLDYLEDAEREKLPGIYVGYDRDEIKRFFAEVQISFFNEMDLYENTYGHEDDPER